MNLSHDKSLSINHFRLVHIFVSVKIYFNKNRWGWHRSVLSGFVLAVVRCAFHGRKLSSC